jgi:hypothetical protein
VNGSVATLHIERFPNGLLRLLEKLAAADGVSLDTLVVQMLHEQLYGFPLPDAATLPPFLPLTTPVPRSA